MSDAQQQKSNNPEFEITSQSQNQSNTHSLPTPSSLQDKFCFLQEIGHGSQGKIFKTKRLADDRIVVIKQLSISSIKTWKEYELFHREAEVLETLTIDGVAKFYDAIDCLDDHPPCSYIIQEYIPGVSLQQMISDGHRLRVNDVYDILIQTLKILYQLHTHEPPVIHRDIKPSNLMITTDQNGQFKVTIIDFGAVANPQVQGGGSTVAGTYGYMPPEQLMGNPVPASDIYSVAALAVHLFSGKSPADIPVKDFRLIFEPEMQDKPHALVTTLRQMLEPNLEQRLCNIPDIIKILQSYKNNHFELVSHQITKRYSNDYEQKLKSVYELNQAGNIDLWQQLPDSSRQIPETYLKMNSSSDFIKSFKEYRVFENSIVNTIYGAIVGVVLFILLCIVAMLAINHPVLIFILILILMPVFIIIIAIIRVSLKSKLPYSKVSLPTTSKIQQLILNGRKGMATITKIEYVPQSQLEFSQMYEMYRTQSTFSFYSTLRTNKNQCMIAAHGRPEFRVQYKFNPPDDKRISDIYHSFVTHSEPENHYQIGDPLPILYEIDDHYFEDIVTSMPYPLPLIDLNDDKTIDSSNSLSVLPVSIASDIKSKMSSLKQTNVTQTQIDIIKSLDYKFFYNTNKPDSIEIALSSDVVKDANQISQLLIAMILNNPNYHECHSTCIQTLISIGCHRSASEQIPEALESVLAYISSLIPKDLDSDTFFNRILYRNFNHKNDNENSESILQFIKGIRIAQIKYHYQTTETIYELIFNLLKLNLSNQVIAEASKLSSDFFKYLIKQIPPSIPLYNLIEYFKSAPGLLAAILESPDHSHYHKEMLKILIHNIIPIRDNPVDEAINAIQWYLNADSTNDEMRLIIIHELFEIMNQSSNEYSFIMDGDLLQTIIQLYKDKCPSDALIQEIKNAPDIVILALISLHTEDRCYLEQKLNCNLSSLLKTNSPQHL